MKKIIFLITLFQIILQADELKIKANTFYGDEKAGLSTFEGDVNIIKGNDELNASKVSVYIDKQRHPTKFLAEGNVSFRIATKEGVRYEGIAQKAIYKPETKEYNFYKNVHLKQIGENKEIKGDEVIVNILENKAYAKGAEKEPVIMIFDFKEDNEK